jgi:hypothetical protein
MYVTKCTPEQTGDAMPGSIHSRLAIPDSRAGSIALAPREAILFLLYLQRPW